MDAPLRNVQIAGESFDVASGFYDYFWYEVENDNWEAETFEMLSKVITNETVFLDIGAWIGPITLFAGRLSRECISIEPDPNAFEKLEANVGANVTTLCRTTTIKAALWNESNGPTVTLKPMGFIGDSMSSVLRHRSKPGGANEFQADVLSISQLMAYVDALLPQHLVVKMDIEGGEFEILIELVASLPKIPCVVYVSLHPQMLQTQRSVRMVKRLLQAIETLRICKKLGKVGSLQTARGEPYRIWHESVSWFLKGKMVLDIVVSIGRPRELALQDL